MRKPGPDIPPARAIHERLIKLGLHPTGHGATLNEFDGLSPCDGCVDLWIAGKEVYGAMWAGPRAEQHERRSPTGDPDLDEVYDKLVGIRERARELLAVPRVELDHGSVARIEEYVNDANALGRELFGAGWRE